MLCPRREGAGGNNAPCCSSRAVKTELSLHFSSSLFFLSIRAHLLNLTGNQNHLVHLSQRASCSGLQCKRSRQAGLPTVTPVLPLLHGVPVVPAQGTSPAAAGCLPGPQLWVPPCVDSTLRLKCCSGGVATAWGQFPAPVCHPVSCPPSAQGSPGKTVLMRSCRTLGLHFYPGTGARAISRIREDFNLLT